MNESDGDAMNIARMKALKALAVKLLMGIAPIDEVTASRAVEEEVEKLAPGCSHLH
jgi:hypothetical protein